MDTIEEDRQIPLEVPEDGAKVSLARNAGHLVHDSRRRPCRMRKDSQEHEWWSDAMGESHIEDMVIYAGRGGNIKRGGRVLRDSEGCFAVAGSEKHTAGAGY